jgi:putative addiction module killer protein
MFGNCRRVGEGVQELRIPEGPGYRVYFGHVGRTVVLLLCGGDKRSQAADIKRAKGFWRDYKRRA